MKIKYKLSKSGLMKTAQFLQKQLLTKAMINFELEFQQLPLTATSQTFHIFLKESILFQSIEIVKM